MTGAPGRDGVERRLAVPGTTNLRDVGGYPLVGGGSTRWGVLYRADAVEDVPGAVDALLSLGVRTVVDLRPEAEARAAPSLWRRLPGVAVVTVPVPDGADGQATGVLAQLRDGRLRRFDEADLARFYVASLEQRAAEYGRAVTTLGAPEALPGVVHCAAGKDRTGLLVALVLAACGVERRAVLEDFALTSRYRPNRLDEFRADLERVGTRPEDVAAVFACPPEALAAALAGVEARHGSVAGYLVGPCGVPPSTLTRLRVSLTGSD